MKRSFLRLLWIGAAVAAIFLLVKKDNVIRWIQAEITIHKQEKTLERGEMEIARMDARIKSLTEDRDSLEAYARERFGFTEPGEDVYIVK